LASEDILSRIRSRRSTQSILFPKIREMACAVRPSVRRTSERILSSSRSVVLREGLLRRRRSSFAWTFVQGLTMTQASDSPRSLREK
jgi:hypothetical protein